MELLEEFENRAVQEAEVERKVINKIAVK
jgi:hypothetical protein